MLLLLFYLPELWSELRHAVFTADRVRLFSILRTCTCKQLHKTANQQSSVLNISPPSKDYCKESTLEQLIFQISEPCALKSHINLIFDYILSCFLRNDLCL